MGWSTTSLARAWTAEWDPVLSTFLCPFRSEWCDLSIIKNISNQEQEKGWNWSGKKSKSGDSRGGHKDLCNFRNGRGWKRLIWSVQPFAVFFLYPHLLGQASTAWLYWDGRSWTSPYSGAFPRPPKIKADWFMELKLPNLLKSMNKGSIYSPFLIIADHWMTMFPLLQREGKLKKERERTSARAQTGTRASRVPAATPSTAE